MTHVRNVMIGMVLALAASASFAAELNCHGAANVEEFRYTWRLRGGLSWIAGLVFPTSGVGAYKTTFPHAGEHAINSELVITSPEKSGFYAYESQMDESGQKTMMTYHGYAWGNKGRKERTLFDYAKRLAHIHKETSDNKVEDKVKPLPPETLRDILTAIYYLRQNAAGLKAPMTTIIYSDGKEYPVIFRPAERKTFTIEGVSTNALGFEIVDAPGGRKWPGGIKVWLSDDARRIPFRIEIRQSMASLQLDLSSVENCAFMQAAK